MITYVFEYLHALLRSSEVTPEMEQEGRAMLERLAHDLATIPGNLVRVVLHESRKDIALPHEIVWHPGDDSFTNLLSHTETNAHWYVIAPEVDGILRDICGTLTRKGVLYHGLPIDLIDRFGDKLQTFNDLGPPVVNTVNDSSEINDAELIVAKPRYGCGSMHVGVSPKSHINALVDRIRSDGYSGPLVFQPWVEGRPVSIAAIGFGQQGYTLLPVADQHMMRQSDGPFTWLHYEGGKLPSEIDSAPVESAVRELLDRLPTFRGYVGFDVVVPENDPPVIIEVNPRLTLSYVGYSHGFEQWTGMQDAFARLLTGLDHQLPRVGKPVKYASNGTLLE